MKMTRYMLLPLALLAFAGCTKVEVGEAPATKVTFQAVNYLNQTKAGEVAVSEFTAFNCMGYLHAEGVDIKLVNGSFVDQGTKQYFFGEDGETITYHAATTGTNAQPANWSPSHAYYWPKGTQSYVDFVGWYGTSEPDVEYEMNDDDEWEATMSWDFSSSALPADANLMYADVAWRYKANNKPATYTAVSGVAEGVPMLFHHALAKVIFQAKAATLTDTDPVTSYAVSITDITLSSIYNKGTLSLTNTDPGSNTHVDWDTEGWSLSGSAVPVAKTGGDLALDTDVKEIPGLVMAVLPQDISDVKVAITYEISTWYSDSTSGDPDVVEQITVEPDIPLCGTGGFGTNDKWEINTKYTYTIIIDPSTDVIKFLPDAQPWIEVTTNPVTIE